jgi:hypothetical protein
MTKQEMLWIASKYKAKGYSIEQMKDGDDCYNLSGKKGDKIKEEISDYMTEIDEIGKIAFYEKYKEFNLY